MSITTTDWASTTDPFILALDHSHSSVSYNLTARTVTLSTACGYINAVVGDKEVQEAFWSRDSDPTDTWTINGMTALGTGLLATGYSQFPPFYIDTTSYFIEDLITTDPKSVTFSTAGKAVGGTKLYSLFVYSSYSWVQRDPAQIIFSWVSYWVNSDLTLKDYLDQDSFEDASDFYDESPCRITLTREAGLSIADQIKKVMDHTADFLVIAPQDTTGDVKLAIKTRRSGITTRATTVDLTGQSVGGYVVRPTDRYTINNLSVTFGPIVARASGSVLTGYPMDFPSGNANKSMQKTGSENDDISLDLDCPYFSIRGDLQNHIDVGFWKDNQDEVEIEFTDLTHFNFEAGDIIYLTGKGYDGTEKFLVAEKTVDWDTMKASCRLIMLKGLAGKSPVYADADNIMVCLRPNSLGIFSDGSRSFPSTLPYSKDPRNIDRLWSEYHYTHAIQHTRGTVGASGGPPDPWPLDLDKKNGWPGFDLVSTTGLEFASSLTGGTSAPTSPSFAVSDYTFYWVGNPSTTSGYSVLFDSDDGGSNQLVIAQTGLGSTVNMVQYFDGSWHGTKPSTTGWQILVFVLDSAGAKIRRNGADIETGLPYTQQKMDNTLDFGLGVTASGTYGSFSGDWMEFLMFSGAHSAATVEAIEAHLAEKYDITI